jgi:hypothetical protein
LVPRKYERSKVCRSVLRAISRPSSMIGCGSRRDVALHDEGGFTAHAAGDAGGGDQPGQLLGGVGHGTVDQPLQHRHRADDLVGRAFAQQAEDGPAGGQQPTLPVILEQLFTRTFQERKNARWV